MGLKSLHPYKCLKNFYTGQKNILWKLTASKWKELTKICPCQYLKISFQYRHYHRYSITTQTKNVQDHMNMYRQHFFAPFCKGTSYCIHLSLLEQACNQQGNQLRFGGVPRKDGLLGLKNMILLCCWKARSSSYHHEDNRPEYYCSFILHNLTWPFDDQISALIMVSRTKNSQLINGNIQKGIYETFLSIFFKAGDSSFDCQISIMEMLKVFVPLNGGDFQNEISLRK